MKLLLDTHTLLKQQGRLNQPPLLFIKRINIEARYHPLPPQSDNGIGQAANVMRCHNREK